MTTRTSFDRYVEFSSTLGNTIKRVDRTVARTLDPLLGWSDAYWRSRKRIGRRWPA